MSKLFLISLKINYICNIIQDLFLKPKIFDLIMQKLLTLFFSLNVVFVMAQNPQDAEAIKNMCGCYEVDFQFAETFSPNADYEFHDNYLASGLEWVQLVEDEQGKIVMQHLLIVEDSLGKKFIVKHWRQDWLYENTDFYMYDTDRSWSFVQLPKEQVKGQWTQKVYQVDDSPRYEGSASWVHIDGKHYWENTTNAPLPRRDFTKRSDYNLMIRTNRHEITEYGWLHEQDNDKILRSEAGEQLIAREKGWNTYTKVEDSRCQFAQDWWVENQAFWKEVRQEWENVFAQKQDLSLVKTVDDKPLFMHMFALKTEETDKIAPLITQFVK